MEKSMERKALEQKLTGFFEELHMHPELSYEEYETTERIKRELAAAGIEILQIPLKTGVTAIVRGAKPGKTYGLRCDIDALPIEEETDLPYKSKTPGKMHACGHDVHTSILLGAVRVLEHYRNQIAGSILFFFQPSEETLQGGKLFAESPKIDFHTIDGVAALHVTPDLCAGKIGVRYGAILGSSDELTIT